jgi:hypothetical protein
MNVPLIEMPKPAAKAAFREYRDAVRARASADDSALMRGYRVLARGNRIIDVEAAMRFAGLDAGGRPKLAICRADGEHCWFTVRSLSMGPRAIFTAQRPAWNWRAFKNHSVVFPLTSFPGLSLKKDLMAVVPSVPPRFRPAHALSNYHILWEAEWEEVPRDPMLLRHLGGMLYAVLAHWDLTELEMAVLKRRLV